MDKPLVTVLITAYNSKYIAETIASADSQNYSPLEILVIDDGSESPVCDMFPKNLTHELRYVYMEHKGLPHGLIRGMNEARGKYVAILDHDDLLTQNSIANRVNALEANPNAALAYGNMVYIDTSGKEYSGKKFPDYNAAKDNKDNSKFIKDILIGLFGVVAHPATMFKKECVDSVEGYDSNTKSFFDQELIIRLADKYPVIHVDEDVIKYRTHKNNFSRRFNYRIDALKSRFKAIDNYLDSRYNNLDYKFKISFQTMLRVIYSECVGVRPSYILKNFRNLLAK